ncbi:MAG: hypothetical protein A2516_08690 [Alphaproteobacteria bacterium RIFOXYD12_FULL_60_8]|nr:MAG: hypothetical protein A2516_08690 [Alphaproteobacteria bacterium RIFOXYD12_FULL_60_8]
MNHFDLTNLPWLLAPPKDFRARCMAATSCRDVEALATYALDGSKLDRLAKCLAAARDLPVVKLALLSNATTQLLTSALVGSAVRYGLRLDLVEAPFGQVMQEALDPNSALNLAHPDLVLLALDYRGLPLDDGPHAALDFCQTLREGILRGCGAPVIFQTIARPPETLFGSYDLRYRDSMRARIDEFNRLLIESLEGSTDLLLDVAGLAETVGLARWHDPVQWHLAKLPFAQELAPLYADHVARLLGAVRGKSRKCLVLDLDNTLWGGVVGDDGLEGLRLGQGNAEGEAFLSVQRLALDLRNRGIILTVCSKNDEHIARKPFKDHPDMLLREEHITVFQANWNDKASNLEAIANTLNIDVSALVFLDDNPAEREQVRQALPMVAVPELPPDPALYPRLLQAAGYFEATAFSQDDRLRAEQYRANTEREGLKAKVRNLSDYHKSLGMSVDILPFNPAGRARIAQLINKSNQFNLTSRRYTESEVAAMEDNADLMTFQVRLRDKFGDNGMISVVICREAKEGAMDIDTWLMSCRVLGRGVEKALLNHLVGEALKRDKSSLIGRYLESGRNALVANHYANLGFRLLGPVEGGTLWSLTLKNYQAFEVDIAVNTSSGNIHFT